MIKETIFMLSFLFTFIGILVYLFIRDWNQYR